VTQVQATLRRRILRAFVGRGLLESFEAKEMLGYRHIEPSGHRRGPKADELTFTPLELIVRIAALVPPPRTHRHRYYGALAPNSPLRAAVAALAQS
jgi:Putative transposase